MSNFRMPGVVCPVLQGIEIDKGNNCSAMILVVRRHGKSGSRVAVIRESA